jgi:hypothetical protein
MVSILSVIFLVFATLCIYAWVYAIQNKFSGKKWIIALNGDVVRYNSLANELVTFSSPKPFTLGFGSLGNKISSAYHGRNEQIVLNGISVDDLTIHTSCIVVISSKGNCTATIYKSLKWILVQGGQILFFSLFANAGLNSLMPSLTSVMVTGILILIVLLAFFITKYIVN